MSDLRGRSLRGKLIVFEGIDGAGKATQVRLLASRFRKDGNAVTTFSFPQYGTPVGDLIKNALRGAYGNYHSIPSYYGSLPYSVDRALAAPKIREALKRGVVISDRYAPTNLAFGGALTAPKERNKFFRFFEDLEYRDLKLSRPNLVIYLSLPIATSRSRLNKEAGKQLDQNERNLAFQRKVATIYEKLSKRRGWVKIDCKDHSPQEIHEMVWKVVASNAITSRRTR